VDCELIGITTRTTFPTNFILLGFGGRSASRETRRTRALMSYMMMTSSLLLGRTTHPRRRMVDITVLMSFILRDNCLSA
jgi:hypothetical protein